MSSTGGSATTLPDHVELVGRDGSLRLSLLAPASLAVRTLTFYSLAQVDRDRAFAAALWRCSVTLRKHVPEHARIDRLGLAVLEYLLEAGVAYRQILAAGELAFAICVEGLPDMARVQAASDFSAAPTGDSTG